MSVIANMRPDFFGSFPGSKVTAFQRGVKGPKTTHFEGLKCFVQKRYEKSEHWFGISEAHIKNTLIRDFWLAV